MSIRPAILLVLAAPVLLWATVALSGCTGDLVVGGPGPQPLPATKRFVAPDGDDRADGTEAHPWRTVARGLTGLLPGTTLTLRAGTYRERDLRVAVPGTPQLPTLIRAMPGETVVLDGGWPEFASSPAGAWTVHDAARGILRSVRAFPGAGRAYGALDTADGGHALVPYTDYASLAADGEDYADAAPYYAGPGVFWHAGDDHLYVRLQHGRYQQRLGLLLPAATATAPPPLRLAPAGPLLTVQRYGAYLTLQGLTLRGAETLVEFGAGSHHLAVVDCTLEPGRYGVLVRPDCHDLRLVGLDCHGHVPPWVARSDVKAQGNAPAHFLQGSALQLEGALDRILVSGCRFTACFDGIDTTGAATRLRITDCTFATIRDDAFELASASHLVEFDHNRVTDAAAAVSWNGSRAPPRALAGTKFLHHNLLDTSRPQLYGRDDPLQQLPAAWRGPAGDGMATGRPFDSHDAEQLDGPDPWKVYCNTIVGGADVDGGGLGLGYRFAAFDAAIPHEVLDNILVQTADHWIVAHARVADGSQVFDGNVYHRPPVGAQTPLLRLGAADGSVHDFAQLAGVRASPLWQASRIHYAPGFESQGLDADPLLDAAMHPAATGPAATPGIDLTARPWPGAGPVPFRGALPPR